MKKFMLFFMLCLLPSAMIAASKLPKGTYSWSEYETAKEEAIKNKKPILFVFTSLTIK